MSISQFLQTSADELEHGERHCRGGQNAQEIRDDALVETADALLSENSDETIDNALVPIWVHSVLELHPTADMDNLVSNLNLMWTR